MNGEKRTSVSSKIRNKIAIIGVMFVLCACAETKIDEKNVQEEIINEVIEFSDAINEERMNETLKEDLKILFDYLYSDKENMTEIILCDENNELYYKYKFVFPTNEISDPYVLHFIDTTDDGLYHHFGLYGEVWETVYEEGEERREHTHNSYSNYWYLNTKNKKIIPMWIYDSDAEDDASYCIDNEEYFKIAEKY